MTEKEKILSNINSRISKVINQPNFDIKGKPSFIKGNSTGILLIHGFDNTAFIMNEYMNFLTQSGFTIYNITLPGRGMTIKEFGNSPWQEWVESAKEDYLLLKKITLKTFISGFSTGAVIALYLSEILSQKKKPHGLILFSPALFFVNSLIPHCILLNSAKLYNIFAPYPKKLNNSHKIFIDPTARKKYCFLKYSSTNAMIQLLKLSKFVKKNIKKTRNPLLIIQSKNDIVVRPYGAKWILKKCKCNKNEYLELHKSGHPVMVDVEKDKVFEKSITFINKFKEKHFCG